MLTANDICRCSVPPTSEFVFVHVLAPVCGRGYKRAREGTDSQIPGSEVLCG
jgi:hypothetical protein